MQFVWMLGGMLAVGVGAAVTWKWIIDRAGWTQVALDTREIELEDPRKGRFVEAVCVGCSCTDRRACLGGCSWIRQPIWWKPTGLPVYTGHRFGLCSQCDHLVEAWDEDGGRTLTGRFFELLPS